MCEMSPYWKRAADPDHRLSPRKSFRAPRHRFAKPVVVGNKRQVSRLKQTDDWENAEMKEPGLDKRHRDADGDIGKKHGNTLVGTLRKIYGASFAKGFPDGTKLSAVLATMGEASLAGLVKHHLDGSLPAKITAAGG
jgi:hypothetical protein